MYFFNVNALARDLRDEKVSEQDKAKYLYGSLLILLISILFGIQPSLGFIANLCIIFTLSFFFRICFIANQKGDNKNFIERYMTLNFPVSFILIGFLISISLILFIAKGLMHEVFSPAIFQIFLGIFQPLFAYIPIYLYFKIKFVAQKQSN